MSILTDQKQAITNRVIKNDDKGLRDNYVKAEVLVEFTDDDIKHLAEAIMSDCIVKSHNLSFKTEDISLLSCKDQVAISYLLSIYRYLSSNFTVLSLKRESSTFFAPHLSFKFAKDEAIEVALDLITIITRETLVHHIKSDCIMECQREDYLRKCHLC